MGFDPRWPPGSADRLTAVTPIPTPYGERTWRRSPGVGARPTHSDRVRSAGRLRRTEPCSGGGERRPSDGTLGAIAALVLITANTCGRERHEAASLQRLGQRGVLRGGPR